MKLFGKHISNQAIFTTMATIVSVCALVVSVMQTYYQHKYLHAAAWPHLQISVDRETSVKDSTKNTTIVKLMNKGVGPAIIDSVAYFYKGKTYKSMTDVSKEIVGVGFLGSFHNITNGEVIAQNEEIINISVKGAKKAEMLSEAASMMKIKIIYSSVHDSKWELISDPELPDGSKTTKLN
jgi:hypothetical protein